MGGEPEVMTATISIGPLEPELAEALEAWAAATFRGRAPDTAFQVDRERILDELVRLVAEVPTSGVSQILAVDHLLRVGDVTFGYEPDWRG